MAYTELHVYDFDNTLVYSLPYDPDGARSKWIIYVINDVVKSYAKGNPEKFSGIDYNKFDVSPDVARDEDQNNRYELTYDSKPVSSELFSSFNSKVRSLFELGNELHGTTTPSSYYIKPDVRWYDNSKSISGDLITSTANAFKKSIANKQAYVVVLTGRRNTPELQSAVQNMLHKNNLFPKELHLSPGGSTFKFKINVIENILKERPTIKKIVMWDDRMSQISRFDNYFKNKGIDCKIHIVKHEQLKEFIIKLLESTNSGTLKPQEIIFTIGIPGSGKSTWIRKHFTNKQDNYVIVSPDELREKVLGSVNAQENGGMIWGIARSNVLKALYHGKNVVFDATNTVSRNRRKLIEYFRDNFKNNKLVFKAVVFPIELDVAKKRVKKDIERDMNRANVPENVIDRMYSQLQGGLSSLKDDFDEVEYV